MQRTALITGGNRGLGLETARQLRNQGWRVVLAVRDPELGRVASQELAGDPDAVPVVTVDLASPGSVADCLAELAERGEQIDSLVNNAGILPSGGVLEVPLGEVARALQVNTLAPLALATGLAQDMIARGWGRIVNVSSGYGSFGEGLQGSLAYAVSKAALNAVTVKLARELPRMIKVNACCPGWVRTRMGGPEATRSVEQGASTITWLASLDDEGPTGGFFRDRSHIPW